MKYATQLTITKGAKGKFCFLYCFSKSVVRTKN